MLTPATTEPYACRGCAGDLAGLVDQTCPTCKVQLVEALDGEQHDQLAAAGAMIAALVRQLDSYGAVVPHLPNIPPGQQSAATRMLAAVGLDCNGRRVHACVVPSPASKESGGVGATSVADHVAAIAEFERDLRARRDAVAVRLRAAGFEMEYGTLQTTGYRKGGLLVVLPMDDRGISLFNFERMVESAERVAPAAIITAILEDAPTPEAVEAFLMTPKVQAPHDAARDWADLAGVREVARRALEAPTPEVSDAERTRMHLDAVEELRTWPGRWGHRWDRQHSAPIPEGLAGLGARGQEPVAPGPTLAEVQAERDYERKRANEWLAQLHDVRRELAALRAALGMAP